MSVTEENLRKKENDVSVIQLSDRVYNVTFPAYAIYSLRLRLSHISKSHEGKYCTKFLNQYSFICSKFYKLYKYNINISHNKTTGLRIDVIEE
jgi:hypothetical protein